MNGEPVDIERIVISIDHADVIDENEAREILRPFVLQVVPVEWMCDDEHFVVYSLRQYVKFDESNTDVDLYSGAGDAPGIVDDLAAYFAVARRAFEKGLSVAELDEAIDDKLAAKAAARETTGRATAQPRPAETDDLNTAVKQAKAENLARAGASAALQLATYKALVKNVDLQNPALAPDERLRRANRLLAAYERVRAARRNFKDSNVQLTAARRIQKAAYREGQRAKRPPAPRGRPRKLVAT